MADEWLVYWQATERVLTGDRRPWASPHLLIATARVCWRRRRNGVSDELDALLESDWRIPARVPDLHTKSHIRQDHGIVINAIDRLESHLDPLNSIHLPHLTAFECVACALLFRLVMHWEQGSDDEVPCQQGRDPLLFLLRLRQHAGFAVDLGSRQQQW